MDESKTPGDITESGLTWESHVYQEGTRQMWIRPMTDAEVQEYSNGFWETFEDVDAKMASPPDYPRITVELVHNGDSYKVTASRTRFNISDVLMTDPIGGKYTVETDNFEEAINTVQNFTRSLS